MGNLVLNGATSGATTLQPTDATTQTITLPANSGTVVTTASSGKVIPTAALPAGTVLQVVQGSTTISTSTSSSTFIDTGLSASITPTNSTSKILVFVTQTGVIKQNGNTSVDINLLRSSTVLTSSFAIGYTNSTATNYIGSYSITYLDSPSTSSSVTYKTQFSSRNNTTTAYVQANGDISTITLMEIAA